MKRFPASKVHLQPDLLGSFPPDVQNSNSALQWGGGGGRGLIGNWVYLRATFIPSVVGGRAKRFHIKSHQITSDTHNFPISKDILFCPNLPASKNLPEEQIF